MSGVPYTPEEDELLTELGDSSRLRDLGKVLGRSPGSVQKRRKRLGLPGRPRGSKPLTLSAVKRARKLQRDGKPVPHGIRHWADDKGRRMANHWRNWSAAEEETLGELLGCESLDAIARRLRRTRRAVVRKARQLGYLGRAFEWRSAEIARRLGIDASTVRGYCRDGHLIHWREGAWIIVHREDAEWLLDNWTWAETDWEGLKRWREELHDDSESD